jgi:hypothetical protein
MQTHAVVARRTKGRWQVAQALPLAACLALLLPLAQAQGSTRNVELRFIPPAGAVSGYRVHLVPESTLAPQVVDLGFVAAGADGIARGVVALDAAESYAAAMTARNDAGESPLSNSIRIAAASQICDPALCDDRNACTLDACDLAGCIATPGPDGALCDDGLAGTSGDRCVAGSCRGTATTFAVSEIAPNALATGTYAVEIRGSGFVAGARLSFANGPGQAPRVRSLSFVDSARLRASIQIRTRSRAGLWDVLVTLPDGRVARLAAGLRVAH